MYRHFLTANKRQGGLTLIELITVVAIVGILVSIGWSYYDAQKRRGYRSDAVIALTKLAQLEERYMNNNGSYTNSITTLDPNQTVVSTTGITPKNTYQIAITIPQNTSTTTTTTGGTTNCTVSVNGANRYYCYQITATAIGAQASDTQCATMGLDQTGKHWSYDSATGKTATNSSTATTQDQCWSR